MIARLGKAVFALSLIPTCAQADCRIDVDLYAGYTIVQTKTISGSIETDGSRKDEFEGCDFGRVIVFEDGTGLKCAGYGYHYAFRPRATFLVNGSSIKMCVDDQSYDMTR